jgi:hypothetical protein
MWIKIQRKSIDLYPSSESFNCQICEDIYPFYEETSLACSKNRFCTCVIVQELSVKPKFPLKTILILSSHTHIFLFIFFFPSGVALKIPRSFLLRHAWLKMYLLHPGGDQQQSVSLLIRCDDLSLVNWLSTFRSKLAHIFMEHYFL